MLKAVVNREEYNVLTDLEKSNYIEKDDKYYLQVESSDGIALEDVRGLKKTVETLRASEKSLKEELIHVKKYMKE